MEKMTVVAEQDEGRKTACMWFRRNCKRYNFVTVGANSLRSYWLPLL